MRQEHDNDVMKTLSIDVDRATGVAMMTMLGTGQGNAMGGLLWSELPTAITALERDSDVRAVVLRGSDDCFSVGLDLRWYLLHYRRIVQAGDSPTVRDALLADAARMQQTITAVARSRLPFIAAVHGECIGAGLDLISACDVRFAEREAVFSLREVRISIVADLGSLQRLPHLIGASHTRELALTGRDVPAAEAHTMGLVTRLLPSPQATFAEARAVAEQIAEHDPQVVAGIKNVLERSQDLPIQDGLDYVALWNSAFLPSSELPDKLARALAATTRASAGINRRS